MIVSSINQKALLSANNYFYPRGGADIVFLKHNKLLEDNGWKVIPFSMRHKNNIQSYWSGYFVSEIEFGKKYSILEKLYISTKVIYSIEARSRLKRLLDERHFKICHCHNIYHHVSPSILPLIKSYDIPIVMTLHDLKLACPNYQMLTRNSICERCRGKKYYNVVKYRCIKDSLTLSFLIMVESYVHNLLKLYENNCDYFIVPSKFLKKKMEEWGINKEKLVYIPNFVDSRNKSGKVVTGNGFLYFGRLAPEKGLRTLIRAAKLADIDLFIAGEGPEKKNLVELSNKLNCRVNFLGFLNREQLEIVIKSCRATVLPSEWYENAPLSIMESFAIGKPVIGANIGGIPELIKDNETGFTFESGNEIELANALIKMQGLNDEELINMGASAQKFVYDNFSQELYLKSIEKLYNKLIL